MKIKINKMDVIKLAVIATMIYLVFASIGNTRYYKMYMGELYGLNWWPRILVATIILSVAVPRIIKKHNEGTAYFVSVVLSIISPIVVAASIMIEAESGVWKLFDMLFSNNAPFGFIASLFFGIVLIPAFYYYLSCFCCNIEQLATKKVHK